MISAWTRVHKTGFWTTILTGLALGGVLGAILATTCSSPAVGAPALRPGCPVPGSLDRSDPPLSGRWRPLGKFTVTAYDPGPESCAPFADGICADGTPAEATRRIVAAPGGIPFGTRLWIEGEGVFTVHDRGGAIKGHRLDRLFDTRREALEYGRRERRVWIWEPK